MPIISSTQSVQMKNYFLFLFAITIMIATTTQAQIISTVAGNGTGGYNGDGGTAINTSLYYPMGVAVDAVGNIFIVDQSNHRVRKVNTSGIISTVAGNGTGGYSGDGGAAINASLNYPMGVAVDAVGNIYIADQANYRIRKVGANGNISTVAGNGISGYSGDGGAATSASLNVPEGVAVDAVGNIFIADAGSHIIRKVNASGVISTVAGNGTEGFGGDGGAATSANLYQPFGVAVDAAGNIFIADTKNNRIRKVNNSGVISTIAGNGTHGFSVDGGAATNASLYAPSGVAVDAFGNIYIADVGNHRIRKTTNNIPTTGLVAWYPFTGNTLDSSGNNNHGTNNGATLTTDRFGKANSAYLFNGLSDYIYVRDTAFLRTPHITISCWINTPKISEQFILSKTQFNTSKGEQYLFWMNDTLLGFEIKRNSGCTPGLNWQKNRIQSSYLSTNKWFYNCLTYDGYTMKYYINGNLISSFNPPNGPIDSCSEGTLNLGRYWMNNKSYYNGKLDDIRIYNRALDSVEIQYLYHEGGYNGSPLPVTFEDIYGLKLDNTIEINWQTSTELNTSHFIIQHSTDGSSFTNIGSVNAIGNGANGYSFTDNSPTNGINYYRLKSADKDGTSNYSKIVSVQFTVNNNKLLVFPNPAKNKVTIMGDHIALIQIIDNLGGLVKTQILKDATNPTLSAVGLPAGVYHFRVQTTDGKVCGIAFIKE